jgi:hypothetical protein
MKKLFLFILISSILTACGFQQRKYTHGYWGSQVQQVPMEDPAATQTTKNSSSDELLKVQPSEAHMEVERHDILSNESMKLSPIDTVIPADTSQINEEEFMYYGSEKLKTPKVNEVPIDPNSFEFLTKEVSENVLWGVLSMIGTVLYFVGIIPATIYFFRALKTQKKLKAMGDTGIYKHLKTMNFAAILANGVVFCSAVLVILFALVMMLILALQGW